jgi:hypothetical protein
MPRRRRLRDVPTGLCAARVTSCHESLPTLSGSSSSVWSAASEVCWLFDLLLRVEEPHLCVTPPPFGVEQRTLKKTGSRGSGDPEGESCQFVVIEGEYERVRARLWERERIEVHSKGQELFLAGLECRMTAGSAARARRGQPPDRVRVYSRSRTGSHHANATSTTGQPGLSHAPGNIWASATTMGQTTSVRWVTESPMPQANQQTLVVRATSGS